MRKWCFDIYLRLSKDDVDKEESNSIATQRSLIEFFLSDKKDIKIHKCYVDDGYTGTDFDRPGYKAMEKDIRSGKINGVIVKDLSRLGRNYIEVGDFIDNVIPNYGLRFISVNDNIDSYLRPESMESLEIPFKNLINESYSKDISTKLRASHKVSKKNGKYIGVVAPYGYLKNKNDGHKFVIDEEAAKVVKKIFSLIIKGWSKIEIVDEFNRSHILTPSEYFKKILKYKIGRVSHKWNTKMLDEIIQDESYIGSLVGNKRGRISHKNHSIVRKPEEEWIIVKNHHKPIIKEKYFYQAQDMLYNRNIKANKEGTYYKYSSYVKCSNCGCNLYRITKSGGKDPFFYCGTYIKTKKCSKHYITEKELDDVVLILLNKYIKMMCDVEKKVENIISFSSIEYNNDVIKIKLVEINKEIEKYKNLQNELIKDYQANFISKSDFENFNQDYLYKINNLRLEKEKLENDKINEFNLEWLEKFKETKEFTAITRKIVDEFIQKIYVNDDRTVKIEFKFTSQFEELTKYLKSKKVCYNY